MCSLNPSARRRGFTLIELAIVLLITGLVAGLVSSTMQFTDSKTLTCEAETREKLIKIRGAVERFARSNDRLPLPAARNIGVDSPLFGRESSGANIDAAGGVSFGALPWQALGLTSDYAGDCWGNKYTYMVTTALTTNASSGGYLDSTVVGNITLKRSATLTTPQTDLAYAIISHGEDGLGAVKLNWSATNPNHGWCSGSADIAYTNCLATAATIMDAEFNNGKSAGANYFDDFLIAAQRPIVIPPEYHLYGASYDTSINTYNVGRDWPSSLIPIPAKTSVTFASVQNNLCALTSSGAAYCWGSNDDGQVGDGTTIDRSTPTAVSGGLSFVKIVRNLYAGVAARDFRCGLTTGGIAYCWGKNTSGEIGDGTTTSPRSIPTAVSGGHVFTDIAVSEGTTCGLKASGAVYCWGDGTSGQLGDGTTVSKSSPVAVTGGISFAKIYSGQSWFCGIEKVTNAGYCWGYASRYSLGNGTNTNKSSPAAVSGGLSFSELYLSADQNVGFSCGLTTSGAAYCWGKNDAGQVGDGTTIERTTPVAVLGGLVFTQLARSYQAMCGLTTTSDTYCWGVGQSVGDGTGVDKSSPVLVVGGYKFNRLTAADGAGYTGFCGMEANGATYCWGSGGNMGIGAYAATTPTGVYGGKLWSSFSLARGTGVGWSYEPTAILDSSGNLFSTGHTLFNPYGFNHSNTDFVASQNSTLKFSYVSSGPLSIYVSCGLTSSGSLYCWGNDDGGQVKGDGIAIIRRTPTLITTTPAFREISIGFGFQCGITKSNDAYCWGTNTSGQTGTGAISTWVTAPTLVAGGLKFKHISTSSGFACGLTLDGIGYCWGNASSGKLGNGATAGTFASPQPVSGGLTFTSLNAAILGVCGVVVGGDAYCWGHGTASGKLCSGAALPVISATPLPVAGGVKYVDFQTSQSHSCGISVSGTAYCCGLAANLGDGVGAADAYTPVAVTGGLTFSKIGLGSSTGTYGITTSGDLYRWGNTIGANDTALSPTKFTEFGGTGLPVKLLSVGGQSVMVGSDLKECRNLFGSGTYGEGAFFLFYQSAAPTGACVAEYRTCTNGSWTGSYTQQTCTPGCDSRTVTWTGGPGCSGTMPALAGGGSTSVNSTSGGTGSVTASCSTSGVVTLSGSSCS